MERLVNIWNGLRSRTKKIIKTFFEAGFAYVVTYLTTNIAGLDAEAVKLLIVSAVAAGMSAVLNVNDKE